MYPRMIDSTSLSAEKPILSARSLRKREYVWNWKTGSDGSYDYFFDVYFDENGFVTKAGPSANALR